MLLSRTSGHAWHSPHFMYLQTSGRRAHSLTFKGVRESPPQLQWPSHLHSQKRSNMTAQLLRTPCLPPGTKSPGGWHCLLAFAFCWCSKEIIQALPKQLCDCSIQSRAVQVPVATTLTARPPKHVCTVAAASASGPGSAL